MKKDWDSICHMCIIVNSAEMSEVNRFFHDFTQQITTYFQLIKEILPGNWNFQKDIAWQPMVYF